eukprot:Tbor_TRINITY_DN3041_c0_g1::TRINITY_DN3041_c0_g1_i1::g.17340::m.17340/K21249/UVRAG; UV radiation resistance-associated gene protein
MIASSVHAYLRRVRHLRQIFCRGLHIPDSQGCYFTISDSITNRELFRSDVCLDSHNPHWETLPCAFLNSYGSVCRFDIHIFTFDSDKLLFKVLNVDMRFIKFLSKTMTVPSTRAVGVSILLGCQDGIYATDRSCTSHFGENGIEISTNGTEGKEVENDIYDCVVHQDDPQLSSRTDRTRVDAIQSWGVSLIGMNMQLDMLHDRYATVSHWANEKSMDSAIEGGRESILDHQILAQQKINETLKQVISGKRAAFKKRAVHLESLVSDIERIDKEVSGIYNLSAASVRNASYVLQLEETRREVVSQLNTFFSVDPSQGKVNNCKIPDKDGFPENAEQAQGLGHICHILTVTSSIYDFSFPHPIFLCGDHSRIGEHMGVDVDMYLPLYICKGYDKQQLRRAVEWLKEDIVNLVDFILVINSKACIIKEANTSPTSDHHNMRELFQSPLVALRMLLGQ